MGILDAISNLFGKKQISASKINSAVKIEIEATQRSKIRNDQGGPAFTKSPVTTPPKPKAQQNGACPDCSHNFEKPPAGKRKCPNCSAQLFVRTIEGEKKYVNQTTVDKLDADRKRKADARRAELKKQNDAEWADLQIRNEAAYLNGRLGGMEDYQFRMATICESEARPKDAFRHWACVFMIALNGPKSLGELYEKPGGKPWTSKAPGARKFGYVQLTRPLQTFTHCLKEGRYDEAEAKPIFLQWAAQLDRFSPPVANSEKAWEIFVSLSGWLEGLADRREAANRSDAERSALNITVAEAINAAKDWSKAQSEKPL